MSGRAGEAQRKLHRSLDESDLTEACGAGVFDGGEAAAQHGQRFDQLGPERARALNAVDTRLKLPVDQVDAVIAAGHDALRVNPTFRDFLKGIGGRALPAPEPAEPPSTPVAVLPDTPASSD